MGTYEVGLFIGLLLDSLCCHRKAEVMELLATQCLATDCRWMSFPERNRPSRFSFGFSIEDTYSFQARARYIQSATSRLAWFDSLEQIIYNVAENLKGCLLVDDSFS